MSRHAQRPDRLEPTVVGTVALAVVLLVVAAVFLAWGRFIDPAEDAAAEPETSLAGASGSTSVRTESSSSSTDAERQEPPRRQQVVTGQVLEPIKVKVPKKLHRDHQVSVPTTFRVSTFNVLGASHTTGSNGRRGFAAGTTRMQWAAQMLQASGVSVAGLQEFQSPQYNVFRNAAPGWAVWPGPALGQASMANSIVWRTDVWELVDTQTLTVPYFQGRPVAMPVVQLRNLESGRTVWFFNTHNPADAYGPAQQYRNRAVALEIGLAQRLSADGSPVVFTGDMNDRELFFCPMTTQTEMHAANGGSTGSSCAMPPGPTNVDWLMGNSAITFSNYHSDFSPLVQRISDHHFVWADATIPAE
jgi:hypothetical protein